MADKEEKVDVKILAKMAHIDVPADQLEKLEQELPNILAFVRTIREADISKAEAAPAVLSNIMRADEDPH